MKTQSINCIRFLLIGSFVFYIQSASPQNKESIAVLSFETKGITYEPVSVTDMVRRELEKTQKYEVLDKYDMTDILSKNNIKVETCFGKNCLVETGKLLKADKVLTGGIERFGEKLIIALRIINVHSENIEKATVVEFINQQPYLQTMLTISINDLLGIPNEKNLVDMLINYDQPLSSPKTKVKLNGPRMGISWTSGKTGERLIASKNHGGYNMFPVTSMFGYQHEAQYLSAGDFQALIEFIGTINGLESGMIIPAITFLNGFRFNKYGYEFGFGPNFRVIQTAKGYYDENGNWRLSTEMPEGANYNTDEALDSRGDLRLSTSLIIAAGKTFKSGYLNIPVNIYVSPRKDGTVVGATFGFNIAKQPKL
ncbi:MAG: hypothetical protein HY738_01555 [Bacteroidia bacterium]|nr:hypothetical protein [Bacteroidia bacterium]